MLKHYLNKINLNQYQQQAKLAQLNNFVYESFALKKDNLLYQEVQELYRYEVPKLGPNGSCSITKEKEQKKYNLTTVLRLTDSYKNLKSHPQTLRLWRLKQVLKKLMRQIGPDWLGIYRKVKNRRGEWVLLKESYIGAYSRAEFPLTEEFAKGSNNSTVGLLGKAVVFQSLENYSGPYYECDNQVQSEYCAPILNTQGEVIGIIDAESFQKNFFTPEKILQLTKVCHDLGEINLGLYPSLVPTK